MIEFKLPELGENIEQGDLVRLMVAPGAKVDTGQSVMELETDKAVVEVPSSVSGTVQEIRVKEVAAHDAEPIGRDGRYFLDDVRLIEEHA